MPEPRTVQDFLNLLGRPAADRQDAIKKVGELLLDARKELSAARFTDLEAWMLQRATRAGLDAAIAVAEGRMDVAEAGVLLLQRPLPGS